MNQRHPDRASLTPVIVGISLAGVVMLGLGFLAASRQDRPPSTPIVTLIAPSTDTIARDSVELRFETNLPLRSGPTGWVAGSHHLHAVVNGVELMPAARDIRPGGGRTYRWTVPIHSLPADLRLIWAGPDHRPLTAGMSRVLRISHQR